MCSCCSSIVPGFLLIGFVSLWFSDESFLLEFGRTCRTFRLRFLKSASPCPPPILGRFLNRFDVLDFPLSALRFFLVFIAAMRRIRGLKLGKHIRRISNWILQIRRRRRSGYSSLSSGRSSKPIARLLSWGRRLTDGAKSICSSRKRLSYVPLDRDTEEKSTAVPKGHLAVYVGQNDGEFHRVLVPVIYFSHPLFEQLLKEAEKEYGFQHQGGITIPCPYSEFENVQSRIKSCSPRRRPPWKKLGCYGR